METSYHLNLTNWRKEYERKLAAPDGWLSISGLYWLKEGENWLGSDPKCDVILPPEENRLPVQILAGEMRFH